MMSVSTYVGREGWGGGGEGVFDCFLHDQEWYVFRFANV